eukprot:SAG11_NODE_14064_length_626_cov_1.624288_1_plen_23_part_01
MIFWKQLQKKIMKKLTEVLKKIL